MGRTNRWPRYASIRMDVRKNVGADIVADARFCPFRDGVFDKVYCDPPHYFKRDNPISIAKIAHHRLMKGWLSPPAIIRYGFLDNERKMARFSGEDIRRVLANSRARGKAVLQNHAWLGWLWTHQARGSRNLHFEI